MSYPMDLDQYSEAALKDELERRRKLRADGRCDYCGQPTTLPPCRFRARHQMPTPRDKHQNVTRYIKKVPGSWYLLTNRYYVPPIGETLEVDGNWYIVSAVERVDAATHTHTAKVKRIPTGD